MNKVSVLIVGGGASGMFCALRLARFGISDVAIVERNDRLGRKLSATGNGQGNVTNENMSAAHYFSSTGSAAGVLQKFGKEQLLRALGDLGGLFGADKTGRVYPASRQASSVTDILRFALAEEGINVLTKTRVTDIVSKKDGFTVKTEQGDLLAECVVLACGGASYPGTGSNGDGARLARALGHTVEPLRPSLVALESPDPDCPAMQGLSLRNCGVSVWERGKKKPVYTDFGELLFTHFGLSGPTILSASAHMRRMEPGRYTVEIDLKPALDDAQLDQRLLRDLEKNKNRNFGNALGELLPQKMIPVVVRRSGIPPEEKCNAVTREQRASLRNVLRHFRVEVSGFGPLSGAIVTAGGVSVREIDPKTMQSKRVPGLYFAGEIIDVDAYTGGFNLQIAFSTGFAAGSNL